MRGKNWTWEKEQLARRADRALWADLPQSGDSRDKELDGPVTAEELSAIQKILDKITPSPWQWTDGAVNEDIRTRYTKRSRRQYVYLLQGRPRLDQYDKVVMELPWYWIKGTTVTNVGPEGENAEFIAAAPTYVRRLLAEVYRLRAELEKSQQ